MSDNIIFPLNPKIHSPTFIATADVHLGKKLYNFPELEDDLRDNLERACDIAIAKKVEYFIIAGDLFEDNQRKPPIIAFVTRMVRKLKDAGIKMVGITGDHDKAIKNECWMYISQIEPVAVEPTFAGLDYFDYSEVTIEEIVRMLKDGKDPSKILWIFLHCQFPQIYDLAVPKKSIDFNRMLLFDNFPNIQGIIAGDLHFAPKTKAYGVGHEAFVGYPGSLGVLDIKEAKDDKHVLYCDGKNLIQIPFSQRRKYITIQFRGKEAENFDVSKYIDIAIAEKYKPVIKINWDSNSDPYMSKLAKLYEYALVKPQQVSPDAGEDAESAVLTCRSDVTDEDKIDKALHTCCAGDEELYELSASVLKGEAKDVLDAFKAKYDL